MNEDCTTQRAFTFGELLINQKFKYPNSDLEWVKQRPFKAYGTYTQNAMTTRGSPYHFDWVDHTREVIPL